MNNIRNRKFSYTDFISFMKRYLNESTSQKGKKVKKKYTNPYKYKKVFNKDKNT